jgi:hypothetical protein
MVEESASGAKNLLKNSNAPAQRLKAPLKTQHLRYA